MITGFRHKGLRRLYEDDDPKGVPPHLVRRLRLILSALDAATHVEQLASVPGWRLHRLRGKLKNHWSISVSGNWRVIFRMEEGDVWDVDLVDYH